MLKCSPHQWTGECICKNTATGEKNARTQDVQSREEKKKHAAAMHKTATIKRASHASHAKKERKEEKKEKRRKKMYKEIVACSKLSKLFPNRLCFLYFLLKCA